MNSKRFCILFPLAIHSKVEILAKNILERTNIKADLLHPHILIQDYDVVIVVITAKAYADVAFSKTLDEAFALNKTFIPINVNNSYMKCLWDRFKFKGPKMNSNVLYLRRTKDMLAFYSKILAFSGSNIIGDPFGARVSITADLDSDVKRNGYTIAELKPNIPNIITLFKGDHTMIISSKEHVGLKVKVKLSVLNCDEVLQPVLISFASGVIIKSKVPCAIFEKDEELASLQDVESVEIKLLAGNHKLKFVYHSKNLNRYITFKTEINKKYLLESALPYKPKITTL